MFVSIRLVTLNLSIKNGGFGANEEVGWHIATHNKAWAVQCYDKLRAHKGGFGPGNQRAVLAQTKLSHHTPPAALDNLSLNPAPHPQLAMGKGTHLSSHMHPCPQTQHTWHTSVRDALQASAICFVVELHNDCHTNGTPNQWASIGLGNR